MEPKGSLPPSQVPATRPYHHSSLQFNILIVLVHILPRFVIVLQPSATIQLDFKISYCNKYCKFAGSHRVETYGKYICVALYLIL
jgi:hypothetical protein